MKSISEKIRTLRYVRGYSQEYIASKMGITQQAYSNMEKSPGKMNLERVTILCELLDIEISVLLNEDLETNNKEIGTFI